MDSVRALAVQAGPDFGRLEILFRRVGALPTLPKSSIRLVQAIVQGDASARELEQIIAGDPALATELLRVASRCPIRTDNPITSLRQAIILLGQDSVRALAVSLSVRSLVHSAVKARRFDSLRFVRHSNAVAIIARYLFARSQACRPVRTDEWSVDEVFAAALMHDISFALLAHVDPKMFDRVFDIAALMNLTMDAAFAKCVGNYASVLGANAMAAWGFPDVFVSSQAFLHDPIQVPLQARTLSCITLADSLASRHEFGLTDAPAAASELPAIVHELVSVPEEEIPLLLDLVRQQLDETLGSESSVSEAGLRGSQSRLTA